MLKESETRFYLLYAERIIANCANINVWVIDISCRHIEESSIEVTVGVLCIEIDKVEILENIT